MKLVPLPCVQAPSEPLLRRWEGRGKGEGKIENDGRRDWEVWKKGLGSMEEGFGKYGRGEEVHQRRWQTPVHSTSLLQRVGVQQASQSKLAPE